VYRKLKNAHFAHVHSVIFSEYTKKYPETKIVYLNISCHTKFLSLHVARALSL
jgi:hypothetical protein